MALFAIQAVDPYAQLGAAIPKAEWASVQTYLAQPNGAVPPSFLGASASSLSIQRVVVERYARILEGLHQASAAAYQPSSLSDSAFTDIKQLEKLVLFAAHVRFSDGNRNGAVDVLLDGLTMARRIRGSSTLGSYVGIACESMVMASFEEHLDQISLPLCDRIRSVADKLLAEPIVVPSDASDAVRKAMGGPESAWVGSQADPYLGALAKELTQLRLLRLHMRVLSYRWQNLKLPAKLGDVAPPVEVNDPLTGLPFHYQPVSVGAYKLYSEGFGSMGPMGLRYRKDPAVGDRGSDQATPLF